MIQKSINVKAKASLKFDIMIWNLDIHCPRDYYPSYNISSKIQIQCFKDFSYSKKLKPKDLKSALSYNNMAKLSKKNYKKDKKKKVSKSKAGIHWRVKRVNSGH